MGRRIRPTTSHSTCGSGGALARRGAGEEGEDVGVRVESSECLLVGRLLYLVDTTAVQRVDAHHLKQLAARLEGEHVRAAAAQRAHLATQRAVPEQPQPDVERR